MKKIVFIIPWFGPFPFWMPYTLASIRKNKDIDFIFFTDNEAPKNAPKNCKFNLISFENYKNLVSQNLGINFTPEKPYKLCDIKPAYGLIHKEEISNYDFWGFCDIDVVFGDLRYFLNNELLTKYEFFSSFGTRVAGHFTIMKNNEHWHSMFKNCPDWQHAFEDNSMHHCFDEKSFSSLFIGLKSWPKFLQKPLLYLTKPHSRKASIKEMYSTPELRYNWVDGSRNFPTEWYWNDGKLTNNASKDQFLYLHFLKWKRDWDNITPLDEVLKDELDSSWKITAKGFESVE